MMEKWDPIFFFDFELLPLTFVDVVVIAGVKLAELQGKLFEGWRLVSNTSQWSSSCSPLDVINSVPEWLKWYVTVCRYQRDDVILSGWFGGMDWLFEAVTTFVAKIHFTSVMWYLSHIWKVCGKKGSWDALNISYKSWQKGLLSCCIKLIREASLYKVITMLSQNLLPSSEERGHFRQRTII